MDNLIKFRGVTYLPIEPDLVLEGAKDRLSEVVVIGYDKETDEPYFATSSDDMKDVLWILEKLKMYLLKEDEED